MTIGDDEQAPWVQLTLEPDGFPTEALEDALLAAGAVAVTLEDAGDDPVLEPAPGETPLWEQTLVTGLFDARTVDIAAVQAVIRAQLGCANLPRHHLDPLENRDWVRVWMDDYHAMRFGDRLWVCPTHRSPPDPNAVIVHMDPGMAFGTGTHPTTALCLEWLDAAEVLDKAVLDFGCGSGILGIASGLLGARTVGGADIDPQAIVASRENAKRNGLSAKFSVSDPSELAAMRFDIVLANILAGPLLALAPTLAPRVRAGGHLVLSGLLARHADEIEQAYAEWFDFASRREKEGWILLDGIRRSAE